MKKLLYLIPLLIISCNKTPETPNPIIITQVNEVNLEMKQPTIEYAGYPDNSYFMSFTDQPGQHRFSINLGPVLNDSYIFHQGDLIGFDENVVLDINSKKYHVIDSLGLFYMNLKNNNEYKSGDFNGNLHNSVLNENIGVAGVFNYIIIK